MGIITGTLKNPSNIISDRLELIKKYSSGKDVLDVGCVDHQASEEETNHFWLHKIIKGVAKNVTGVDFEQDEVEKLKLKGYDVVYGNVETIEISKQFDTIVAGEIIEHLSNPGIFLENMYRHLKEGGILILTTPNAFAARYHVTHLVKGIGSSNMQHTFYYDYFTLKELCNRYPFEIIQSSYFFEPSRNFIKNIIVHLLAMIRKSYAPRILFVLRKM